MTDSEASRSAAMAIQSVTTPDKARTMNTAMKPWVRAVKDEVATDRHHVEQLPDASTQLRRIAALSA
jgi:hypothetical protein